MSPDILVVRNGDGYRVLHGYLHLASALSMSNEAIVEASGEGQLKAIRTQSGILIGEENRRLPLLGNTKPAVSWPSHRSDVVSTHLR